MYRLNNLDISYQEFFQLRCFFRSRREPKPFIHKHAGNVCAGSLMHVFILPRSVYHHCNCSLCLLSPLLFFSLVVIAHRAENSVGVIRCVVGIFNPCENRGHHMRDSDVVDGLSLHGDMAVYITGRTARLCSAR